MIARLALLAVALVGLSGCGLHPLYAGGTSGPVARQLAQVTVAPIAGKNGWLVHNGLVDRLRATGSAAPRYRLEVTLDDQIIGFGLRRDNEITRERRTLRARYRLIDTTSNEVVLDATADSDAGIDVVNSEYATIAAEQSALERLADDIADQIVARIALYAERSGKPQ
jgi:LPS-assembly lipoprotein